MKRPTYAKAFIGNGIRLHHEVLGGYTGRSWILTPRHLDGGLVVRLEPQQAQLFFTFGVLNGKTGTG